MLIDLLNSSNYIMVNIDSIKILGLNASIYCAELLNIYKKAYLKHKLNSDNYFTVDREFIQNRTSITVDEQLKCDIKLEKIGILKINPDDVNIIKLDIEKYASILASEDVQLTEQVHEKMSSKKVKGSSQANKNYMIQCLKQSVECRTPKILEKIYDWIETVCETKMISKAQVKLFKNRLDDYCDGDMDKAIAILNLAITHAYIDCDWAINLYERDNKQPRTQPSQRINNNVRVTPEKRTTAFSEETF